MLIWPLAVVDIAAKYCRVWVRENGRLVVFDQDENAYNNRPDDERLIL